jgi:hypothetical protein
MPKSIIDYSHTIIYKIYCKDEKIIDIYIGHTTNFVKRKYQHKILSNSGNQLKIYETIRKNGGWDNWDMVEIACYNCKNSIEARIREQEHYDLLKPTLNKINPINKKYNILIESFEKEKNNFFKYECEFCDIKTNFKKDYNNHLLTAKHMKLTKVNETLTENPNISIIQPQLITNKKFDCELCDKKYTSRVGLWKHKKSCFHSKNINEINNNSLSDKDLIIMLVNQNIELMKILKKSTDNNCENL